MDGGRAHRRGALGDDRIVLDGGERAQRLPAGQPDVPHSSGLTLTIVTAGLDLLVGANVGLSACLAATVMQSSGSVALGAATGLVFGAGVVASSTASWSRCCAFRRSSRTCYAVDVERVMYWFMGGDTIHGFSPGFEH